MKVGLPGGNRAQRTALLGAVLAVLVLMVLGYRVVSQRRTVSQETATLTKTLEKADVVSPTPLSLPPPGLTTVPTKPAVQTLTDESRLFTLELPVDWPITRNEGRKGIQLSRITAQSPDFRFSEDTTADGPFTPQRYEQGAEFSVHVVRGRKEVGEEGARTTGLQEASPITIGGITGTFRTGAGISTVMGNNLDAIIHEEGLNYIFSLHYNPDVYPQGEDLFRTILASFTFTR